MKSFKEFYPFYLQEHQNKTCKILHFIGTLLVFLVLFAAIVTWQLALLWILPVVGYGFAWVGHFKFEKNRPATFKHPLYSLMGDFVMFYDLFTGRLGFNTGAQLIK